MVATKAAANGYDEATSSTAPRRMRVDPAHESAPTTGLQAGGEAEAADRPDYGAVAAPDGSAMLALEEPTAAMIAAVAGEDLENRREQLELQACQLAEHLHQRLREVDRREATLNARVAQLESDLRASRVWLRERELSFQEGERQLEQQILELRERTQEPAETPDPPTPLDDFDPIACLAEIAQREQQLQVREDELRQRRFEVDRQSVALTHAQQIWQQQREQEVQALDAERTRFQREMANEREPTTLDEEALIAQRQEQLQTAELLVNRQARELESERSHLADERRGWEQKRRRQQEALDELRAAAERELADRRAKLDVRQEWIESQRTALEQGREEALRLQRQSLEMRLLVEQLWSEITGTLGHAEAADTINQLQQRLAEQYRLEEQRLASRHSVLLELSEKIAGQHRDLTQLKHGMRQWSMARQAELNRQAAELDSRESALQARPPSRSG